MKKPLAIALLIILSGAAAFVISLIDLGWFLAAFAWLIVSAAAGVFGFINIAISSNIHKEGENKK